MVGGCTLLLQVYLAAKAASLSGTTANSTSSPLPLPEIKEAAAEYSRWLSTLFSTPRVLDLTYAAATQGLNKELSQRVGRLACVVLGILGGSLMTCLCFV